ncbi:MAG: hypothetical protein K6G48_04535 [Acholeplasmatales bacterium]|nr:hypothetical protein [Acholeplasmatales bacterium]
MRKITFVLSAIIILGFLIIIGESVDKNDYIEEESFSLRCNYSYLYDSDSYMKINIYSNTKNPSFSYKDKNTYYLCDYDEYFIVEVSVIDIVLYEEDSYYRFEVSIEIPNATLLYVPELYFKASNEYHIDLFNIGSLNVRSDVYTQDVVYKSMQKDIVDNSLIEITLLFDVAPTIKNIYASEALGITYNTIGNNIVLSLSSINLTYEMYLVLETANGYVKIKNVVFNNNTITFNDNRYYMSVMVRSDLND